MARSSSGISTGSHAVARTPWPTRTRRRSYAGNSRRDVRRHAPSDYDGTLFVSPWFYGAVMASCLFWAWIIGHIV